jgi:hypothetical protein
MKLKKNIMENPNPCWKGYEMVGMKMKDGKEVPNCVPKNEVKENVSVKKDRRGNDTDILIVKLDGKEYEVAFSADGWKDAYGIAFPNEDSYRMLNKDKKAKEVWNKMKPMVDKYLKTKNEVVEASATGEWVTFLSTNKGKKLLKTFKSATPAKTWLKKNADKFLEKDVTVGAMTKQKWDERETKYAIEGVTKGNSNYSVSKVGVTEISNKPSMAKSGKDIFVDTTFVQLSNKFGKLDHMGMGNFVVKTDKGDVEFHRKSNKIDGFTGRAHMLIGDTTAISTLIKNIKPNIVTESVNEGKWSNIMKGVRGGSQRGPWTIVVFDSGKKVIHQQPVDVRDAIPAHYEDIKRKFPNRKLSIEDNSGMIVYKESVSKKPTIKEGDCGCGGSSTKLTSIVNGSIVREAGIPKLYLKIEAVKKEIERLIAERKSKYGGEYAKKLNAETDPKKREQLKKPILAISQKITKLQANLADMYEKEEKYYANMGKDDELDPNFA